MKSNGIRLRFSVDVCSHVCLCGGCWVSYTIILHYIPSRQEVYSAIALVFQSPQHWGFGCTRPHLAFPVSVNQIQATMLDQQADALIQSLVCVYLCECISHVCGCWQRPKEGAGLPRTGVTHGCKLSNTGAGLHSGPLNEQQVLKLPSGFSKPQDHG